MARDGSALRCRSHGPPSSGTAVTRAVAPAVALPSRLMEDCDNLPHPIADSLLIDSVQNETGSKTGPGRSERRMTRSLAATVAAAALILSVGVGLSQRTLQAAFTERRASFARERAILAATERALKQSV